jgi:hypothetical protein
MNQSEYELSKYQRNDIFRVITSSGLPVTDFELVTRTDLGNRRFGVYRDIARNRPPRPVTLIRHPISGSSFGIRKSLGGSFEILQQIGRNYTEEELYADKSWLHGTAWKDVPPSVASWARGIGAVIADDEKYERTPDLWDEFYESREFLTGQHEQRFENTPFTSAEQAQVSDQIQQIKAYIGNTYQLSSEQMSRVESRLDQAEQASRRMGRKDWLLLFNGAVFSLILSDLITPQAAQHVLVLAIHGMSHIIGSGGLPPHLPPAR